MSYELYRESTIGVKLTDSLDALIQSQAITPSLAMKVLQQFDKSISELLSKTLKNKASIKGYLSMYRSVDTVWTFLIENAVFKIDNEQIEVDRCKIVACDGRNAPVQ